MKKKILYLFTFFILVSFSCTPKKTQTTFSNNTVKDIDGNVYKTVKIGKQWWMAENLKVTHYRNGDKIPCLNEDDEWDRPTGAYCYYNNDTANIRKYGILYNWFAVDEHRNIAPAGWHVPSDDEWQVLVDYLGGDTVAGGKMKSTGTIEGSDGLWRGSNEGTINKSGFSALPGGYRYNHGVYDGLGTNSYFWSSTESNGGNAWHRYLYFGNSNVYCDDSGWKQAGYSIRCVKD